MAETPRQLRPARAAGIAAAAGLACMALELTAVRLLAPSFGDSAYVWTNVIGVILLALAAGAFTGGRLAERASGSPLRALLLGAAVLVAIAPLLAPWLGDWMVPNDLPLDAAMPALVRGSLATTLMVFAPPVWLLGAVTPGLIVACVRAATPAGRAAGAIGAAGTLGSLIGTFAATHWLVPQFGCRATLWCCALLLAAAACACGGGRRATAIVTAIAVSLWLHGAPLGTIAPGSALLAARETRYQYLRVVRVAGSGATPTRTELKINEGLDSYHSLALEGHVLTSDASTPGPPSSYYDYHALVPFLVGDGQRPKSLTALSLGDAAGTFRRIYAGVHPGSRVDAVEIDPVAVQLGDEFFAGRRAAGEVLTDLDARVFVAHASQRWHVIHVDAYSHQVNIPAHLASREFFVAARQRLWPGGAIACNVGGIDANDPVVVAIAGTMAAVFGDAVAFHVPNSRNCLVVARRDQIVDAAVLARLDPTESTLPSVDQATWRKVVDSARAGQWQHMPATPTPLTDDRPVLDQLLFRSYVDVVDDGTPVPIHGPDAPEGAEATAFAAFERHDAAATLSAAQRSRLATPYLRYLCGSARWQQRRLDAAAAEYRAALTLDPAPELAQSLRQLLDNLATEATPVAAAVQVGVRNGWLAAAAIGLLAALAAAAHRVARMPAAPSVSVATAAR